MVSIGPAWRRSAIDPFVLGEGSGADVAHREPLERRDHAEYTPSTIVLIAVRPVVARGLWDLDLAG
jgi:hypothetical protein